MAKIITIDVWGTLVPVEPAIKAVVDVLHKSLGGRIPYQTVQALINEERRKMKLARREKHEVVPPIYTLLDIQRQLRNRGINTFFDVYQTQDAIDDAISRLEITPYEDAVEAIKHAKAEGYRIGIISNVLLWRSRATRKLLETLGISQLVDLQLYADDIGYVKPAVQIFEAAKTLLLGDVEPDVYLHIGDDFYEDFLGALMAGYGAVLIDRREQHTKRELTEAVPCRAYIVRSLKALPLVLHEAESCIKPS
ncbi:HAD-superfamily hydrolase, subfamily IA, variant 1 [Pyrobaculum islandicum DSM 4184]|uniref:HAD-superfamily hydrolase, subfamily IA, variant 1 n=1 Tax=Pyrobaculum islandicum (strain DSM 4184 / JCM 9189 / GEO3) TaxID=384616 RepID=A1RRE8_PYRIL|nr:HAD family hydrolase [Pyrobaculum islandicum]ABL87530.1 HAD-superfamily hydrolase, subfamily IA, variant 1 [Pyrobaculum islandicum DSM 4184]